MASGRRSGHLKPEDRAGRPLLYTAQDVARFCEVDLKTIHHWSDAGKIPHHRTEGRHLRFRRNHVLRFLRAHGYPLPAALTAAAPVVFVVDPRVPDQAFEDVVKKLASRFVLRRFPHAAAAVAHLVAAEPDALVCALDDPTWAGAATIAALKADPSTSWAELVVLGDDPSSADLAVAPHELARLPAEMTKLLGVV